MGYCEILEFFVLSVLTVSLTLEVSVWDIALVAVGLFRLTLNSLLYSFVALFECVSGLNAELPG